MADLQGFDSEYTYIESAVDSANSLGIAVSPNTTIHTMGAIKELIASTAEDTDLIELQIWTGAAKEDYAFDILIGAASSEVVIASAVRICGGATVEIQQSVLIPVSIPAGTRLSARVQASIASAADGILIAKLFSNTLSALPSYSNVVALNESSTRGTAIDAGATINTKGSWAECVASTSDDYARLMVSIGRNDNNNFAAGGDFLIDIALGTTIIHGDYGVQTESGEQFSMGLFYYIDHAVPAGTQIQARCQSSGNDASDRIQDVIVYGVH